MSFHTDAARWRALMQRDTTANGHFVYSVKSTNIYCRPTCPARLARRANIGFYKTPAEAEAAGFRACKRCKPDNDAIEDPQERAVAKACCLIEERLKENNPKSFRLQDLAKNVGLTPRYFHKIFKDKTGMTPKEYAKSKMVAPTNPSTLETEEAQTALEPFQIEDFDFNDLVDFNMNAGLPLDNALIDAPEQIHFGQEVNVNIQPSTWNATYGPNIQDPELHIVDDKFIAQLGTLPGSNLSGWKYGATMTSAVSTFELDAALLLGADELADVLPELNAETFKAFV